MYIIWIVWELCVFHSVSGTLYLSYSYYNWTHSLNGCGSRSIATLQNTPLNSSEWSSIELDSEGAWLGSYYSVTPFYWTNGECFQFNSSALKDIPWKAFRNLTAEKCAFFCASKSSLVKYIALQDTHCYCLDKKPDTSFSDGCKTNCTGVLNKRCGSVQRETIFAYRKLEDSQGSGIRRVEETDDLHENCITLFVDDSIGTRRVYFDQDNCSKHRSFLCRKDGHVSSVLIPRLTFEDATNYCMRLNKTLAYLTSNNTKIDRSMDVNIKGATNFWIGLRRFSTLESVEDSNISLVTPRTCIAVTKKRQRIVTRLQNCSKELRYVCQKKNINVGTTASNSETTVNNTITNIEDLTTEHTRSSLITGTIIGVAVFLVIIGIIVF